VAFGLQQGLRCKHSFRPVKPGFLHCSPQRRTCRHKSQGPGFHLEFRPSRGSLMLTSFITFYAVKAPCKVSGVHGGECSCRGYSTSSISANLHWSQNQRNGYERCCIGCTSVTGGFLRITNHLLTQHLAEGCNVLINPLPHQAVIDRADCCHALSSYQ
jgi:hypothetical protein